ncbi:MAG: DNRLRE domain-containing protein [Candidatus Cloacimonetes bacterium]|nr:DNRLRE domain-containing protein [Candidatus Cloacimonadota bacterium]
MKSSKSKLTTLVLLSLLLIIPALYMQATTAKGTAQTIKNVTIKRGPSWEETCHPVTTTKEHCFTNYCVDWEINETTEEPYCVDMRDTYCRNSTYTTTECTRTLYSGTRFIEKHKGHKDYVPMDEVVNVTYVNDSIVLSWWDKRVVLEPYIEINNNKYKLKNMPASSSNPNVPTKNKLKFLTKIKDNKYSYYYNHTMDAKLGKSSSKKEVFNTFGYNISESNANCTFKNNALICDEIEINFAQAVNEQNLTLYTEKEGKKLKGISIKAEKEGTSIFYIDPTIQLQDNVTENLNDAKILEDYPDYNAATSKLQVGYANITASLLMFNISSIPNNANIIDAGLYLYQNVIGGTQKLVGVKVCNTSRNWNEETVTWNTKPIQGVCSDNIEQNPANTAGWRGPWDVTSLINTTYNNVSLELYPDISDTDWDNDIIQYNSKEYATASLRPYLNITYSNSTNISDCAVLDIPGHTYYLTTNITDSSTSYCMNISANNVTLDCQGHTIDGDDAADYGIYIKRSSSINSNIVVKNCTITDWDTYGSYIATANNVTFEDITYTSNPDMALYVASDYNKFTNIISNYNGRGITLNYADSNTFTNIIANSNPYGGIYLWYSNSNIFANMTVNSNANSDNAGIYLYCSHANVITYSKIENNSNSGITLCYSDGNVANKIYNNLFNNTNNIVFVGTEYSNNWNTTYQSGTNIYDSSIGYIAGNWYSGFSDNSTLCPDTTGDGFCDNAYDVKNNTAGCDSNNCDYKPISSFYGNPTNQAPSFTVTPDDASTVGSPTNVGQNVTFTATATDADGDNYTLYICKTNAFSSGSCTGGEWCHSTSTTSGSQASCKYLTQDSDSTQESWYAFAYDGTSASSSSSTYSPMNINHRPYASGVVINDSTPYTDSIIQCNYTFNDADGDSESSVAYKWYKNNVLISGETSSTLNLSVAGNGNKGDIINCSVQVTDEHSFSDDVYVASSGVTIQNYAPNTVTSPNSPTDTITGQALSVNLNVTVSDNDSDTMNVSFYNNDTKAQIGTTQTSIASGSTAQVTWSGLSAGTTYSWYVNVTDGTDTTKSSVWTFTTSYTPILTAYDTYPDTAYTNTDLKFNITCTDQDSGDTITGYLQVYNGTTPYGSVHSSTVTNGTETTLFTLGSGNTTKGETWKGEYWCGDGVSNSSKQNDSVTILNTAPTTPTSSTLNQTIYVGQNLTATCSGSTDLDFDSITYYYRFYNENDATELQAYSTDNTYVLQSTDAHDVINVTCKAYDGTAYSSTLSNTTTVSNTAPTAPDVGLNSSITVGQTLTITCENSTDIDSDSLTYYSELYNINDSTTLKAYSTSMTYTIQTSDAHDTLRARCKASDSYTNSTEGESNITVSNTAPNINSYASVPEAPEYTNTTYLTINITDIDNDSMSWCNFTVTAPNGTIILNNINGTHSGVIWNSTTFNLTSTGTKYGTWEYNVSCYDAYNTASQSWTYTSTIGTYNYTPYETWTFSQTAGNTELKTFIFDATGENSRNNIVNGSVEGDLANSSYYLTVSYNTTSFYIPVNGTVSIQANITSDHDNTPAGTYTGNLTFNRTDDGTILKIPVSFSVAGTSADINVDPTSKTTTMYASDTSTWTLNVSNVGDRTATNCSCTFAGTIQPFSSCVEEPFNVSYGNYTLVSVKYTNPSEGDYSGTLTVSCTSTASGGTDTASVNPISLSVLAAPSGGGGGGGSYVPPENNITIPEPAVCGDGICEDEKGENSWNCPDDCAGLSLKGLVLGNSKSRIFQILLIVFLGSIMYLSYSEKKRKLKVFGGKNGKTWKIPKFFKKG